MALLAPSGEVPVDQVPAARFTRLVAFVIDIALIVGVAAGLSAGRRSAGTLLTSLSDQGALSPDLTGVLTRALTRLDGWEVSERGLAFTLYAIYSVVLWGLTGTSLGKWLLGVQLVRPNGSQPGFLRSTVRFIAMAVLAPFLFTWWTTLFRADRAALHDLIAGTRVVRLSETGFRRLTRGTMRRAISDLRWAAAIGVLLLLAGGAVFVGARFTAPASGDSALVQPVDEVTQEAVKGAILEYNRMEEYATFRLDASILEPRATPTWLARKAEEFAELRRRGLRQESRLLQADFKGFRWVGDSRIEADVVEVWVSVLGDVTGRVLQERPAHEVPQTAIVVKERGRWKLADVRHYEPGAEPF